MRKATLEMACALEKRLVEAEHEVAESAVDAAASELRDALNGRASVAALRRLVAHYDAAFNLWAEARGFDLSRSSFDQRAERGRAAP